jgi:hypothetical protein
MAEARTDPVRTPTFDVLVTFAADAVGGEKREDRDRDTG